MKALIILLVFIVSFTCATEWFDLEDYTFEDYVQEFGKDYSAEEYSFRKTLFEAALVDIRSHNADSTQTWKKGVNHLTDRTEDEFKRLFGYKRGLKEQRNEEFAYSLPSIKDLPTSVDWRQKGVVTPPKNQGGCGSCWAFATSETLESHWAIKTGQLVSLSEQQILDCTPNPQHCGGKGGCQGGTAELAYDRIMELGGLTSDQLYPYKSGAGRDYACLSPVPEPVAKISNYTVLPPNKYDPVMNAIATVGPLAIAVDASTWSFYSRGVFTGCNTKNLVINHAVVLVGYGTDPQLGDYWLVRNSWGASWGENGYIRLKRTSTVTCATDLHPADGTGCDGGPPEVTVCGICGILYDVCYPIVSK